MLQILYLTVVSYFITPSLQTTNQQTWVGIPVVSNGWYQSNTQKKSRYTKYIIPKKYEILTAKLIS